MHSHYVYHNAHFLKNIAQHV